MFSEDDFSKLYQQYLTWSLGEYGAPMSDREFYLRFKLARCGRYGDTSDVDLWLYKVHYEELPLAVA